MAKSVAVVVKDKGRQYEALRSSLGLLLDRHVVTMIVLDHEIEVSEEYMDNMGFIDEMGGKRFSNIEVNIASHGFEQLSLDKMADYLLSQDLVVPF
jgi:hypothetical protein